MMLTRPSLRLALFAYFLGAASICAADPGFDARVLARHNGERAVVGVPPLAWDSKLAADAAVWAKQLIATRRFEHSPDNPDAAPQGENLWMGTAHAYTPENMVDGWIEERQFYRPGLFPNVTTTANWSDVGHYTQLIWRNTTHVGCALATGGGNEVLVCRYSPAGNWDGESPTGRSEVASKRAR